jgi:hypothetical protein
MVTRPYAVTIIAWICILGGGWGFLQTLLAASDAMERVPAGRSLPMSQQFAMQAATAIVLVVSGLGILNGKNWARLLYLTWYTCAIVYWLIIAPLKMLVIPVTGIFLMFLYFLFRPDANAFFSRATASRSVSQPNCGL